MDKGRRWGASSLCLSYEQIRLYRQRALKDLSAIYDSVVEIHGTPTHADSSSVDVLMLPLTHVAAFEL